MTTSNTASRRYWVVSPNVRNNKHTVHEWRQASVRMNAAFMGWYPDDHDHGEMGPKFAGTVASGVGPGDVVLIARRDEGEPDMVGFGVVQGKSARKIKGFKPPNTFGSLRKLSPFRAWSRAPSGIPLIDVLQHTKALVQLHPERDDAHRKVCEWMERKLHSPGKDAAQRAMGKTAKVQKQPTVTTKQLDGPGIHQLDFNVRTKKQVIRAKRVEAALVDAYRLWLEQQDRKLAVAKYGHLQCDCYEKARHNLIEAKASTSREHVRMAVGQLLDYAFQGKDKLGDPHKAILLPDKVAADIETWLRSLDLSVVWKEGKKFQDNANGQFM